MKRISLPKYLLAIALQMVICFSGRAELIDRGGGLIYDTVLNITWLKDANYASTMGYSTVYAGQMSYFETATWVKWLVYQGYNDWQLPPCVPLNGSDWNHPVNPIYDGSADESYNVERPGTIYAGGTASSMANLYYDTLSNNGVYDTNGVPIPSRMAGRTNAGPFTNLFSTYWSAGIYPPFTNHDWYFDMNVGLQATGGDFYSTPGFHGWPVRLGDSAPLAGTAVLAPVLQAGMQGGQIVLSWPSLAAGFFLKSSFAPNPAAAPGVTNVVAGDILDLGAMEEKLRAPADSLSKFIQPQISPAVSNEMYNYNHANNGPDAALQRDLASELSRISALGPLYNATNFIGIPLSPWTQALLAQNPTGPALLHLNRYLLEDAYPLQIFNSVWHVVTNTSVISPDRQTISVAVTPSTNAQYFILYHH